FDHHARAFESGHSRHFATTRIFSFDRIDIHRIDRRRAHRNDCFINGGLGPGFGLNLQNLRRISVPFVNDRLYSFVHSMNSASHPQLAATNLQTGARLALIGLVVNIAFAIIKISGGVFGNAYALIADGIESALDVAGSLIIWSGLKFAARPPDETHPYGHGKAEPIAAVVVAFGVLAAALGLATESIREIRTPHHGPAPFTLGILIVVIVVKEILFRYVNRVGRNVQSTAVQTDAWHHRSDALTSAAAFIGITAALIGGRRWQSADDWAAIFACVVIAANGIRLMRPAFYEIMDTAPRKIITAISS